MKLDKTLVHRTAVAIIKEKIKVLAESLASVQESINSDTKSTAGDKHETGRASAQLELEQLGKQIEQAEDQLEMLRAVDSSSSDQVKSGSLIELSSGWFYLSVSLGKIIVEDMPVFCLSAASPLGQELIGKKAKEKVKLNGTELTILSLN